MEMLPQNMREITEKEHEILTKNEKNVRIAER